MGSFDFVAAPLCGAATTLRMTVLGVNVRPWLALEPTCRTCRLRNAR